MPLSIGLLRAALGLLRAAKIKKNEKNYKFTNFRGERRRRGRASHASSNQNVAGIIQMYYICNMVARRVLTHRLYYIIPHNTYTYNTHVLYKRYVLYIIRS